MIRFVLTRLNAQEVIGYNSNIPKLGDVKKMKTRNACLWNIFDTSRLIVIIFDEYLFLGLNFRQSDMANKLR